MLVITEFVITEFDCTFVKVELNISRKSSSTSYRNAGPYIPVLQNYTIFANTRQLKKQKREIRSTENMFSKEKANFFTLLIYRNSKVRIYVCIQNEGHSCGLNLVYLLILNDTCYRTCEHSQECSWWWKGYILIQFKGSSNACSLLGIDWKLGCVLVSKQAYYNNSFEFMSKKKD